ncbi:hypothetical protein [Nonomuraea sp. KM90]
MPSRPNTSRETLSMPEATPDLSLGMPPRTAAVRGTFGGIEALAARR